MSSFNELFSKRQKKQRESHDIFTYDILPQDFRTKVIYLLKDALGDATNPFSGGNAHARYKEISDFLHREYGVFSLIGKQTPNAQEEIWQFFYECDEPEKVLDIIELTFRIIYDKAQKIKKRQAQANPTDEPTFSGMSTAALSELDIKISPEEAIEKLNGLFLEHRIGYQFESGQIMQVDSQLMHVDVLKPVLNLLNDSNYSGANEEFLKAHEHYRHKRYKECLNECLKAFESTMKAIYTKCNWPFDKDKDTARKLIDICLQKNLIPGYMQSHFTALRTCLESGIPTVRNRLGGHGQGAQVNSVPDYFPRYLLNLTATTILFLIDAEKYLP